MGKTIDGFVKEIQEQIYEETKAAYGKDAFQRWLHPKYRGALEDPDGYACVNGSCGDTMEVFLRFDGDHVKEASYRTDGCGSSNVCGSLAAELALGKNPDELLDITGDAILEKLNGLEKTEEHCAFLAAETLQEALNDYMIKKTSK